MGSFFFPQVPQVNFIETKVFGDILNDLLKGFKPTGFEQERQNDAVAF